jgi:lysophospholipase L1-like esterase
MIYVVGDSHTAIFKNDPAFQVVEIAGTAHNLINVKSTSNSNQKLQQVIDSIDKNSDLVMLVFGETDCRFHIYYQAQKRGVSISDIINETVFNYGLALHWLRGSGIIPIVFGIPPPGTYDRFVFDTPSKPYASPEILAKIYSEFNSKMKIFCSKRAFAYIDIYSKTVDDKGFLKKEYAADAVHLNLNAKPLILEMLKERIT